MKMKHSHRRLLCAVLCATLGVPPVSVTTSVARAEDIDLFVSAAATAATAPNILIVLDNSANWNSNAQHWPTPAGETGSFKQGESELRAIQRVLSELDGNNPRVNLGLMVHRSGNPDGGIVRFGIRPMNNTNKNAFIELIGPRTGCSATTNSLNGTPNCMLQNFSGTGQEQTNNSNYGTALFNAYKYFGGHTAPAYATLDNASQVTNPKGPKNFAKERHFDAGGAPVAYMDREAYSADFKDFVSPVNSACAKNYIVFIGNGFPGQENTTDEAALTLRNVNLGTTPQLPAQLSQPDFTTITTNVTDNLGTHAPCSTRAACATAAAAAAPGLYDTYSCTGGSQNNFTTLGTSSVCQSNAACVATATATFPGFTTYQCTGGSGSSSVTNPACAGTSGAACAAAGASLLPGFASYTCSGGTNCGGGNRINQTVTGNCAAGTLKNQTMQGINGTVCTGTNFLNQTMQGTKAVSTLTPLPTFSAPSKPNYADEWAKFLYTTDVTELPGQQNVTTFTIDVYKDLPSQDQTSLLFNMAKFGGGKYFQASNEEAIINALRQIMIEIQSVNSVFASASLPINATNRSQNENQVFIGMFRPDGSANPRWYGNLKRYQIGQFGQDFKLADASTPPVEAVSSTTGFVQPCAKSFWTVDSGDYWLFQNGSAGQCTTSPTSIFSDSPDGPQVEKGAVAEVLRRGNNPPTAAGPVTASPSRTLYTCMNATTCCAAPAACGASPATELMTFDRTNVSKAQLGNALMSDLERDNIVNFTIGQDLFDHNTNSNATEVRPSIHGDVAHSRPLPVNYAGTHGVVLYYGANDGTFRAVRGSDGKELWAFIAPEHHSMLKRLTDNSPPILYPNQVASLKIVDGDGALFSVGDTITGDFSAATAEVTSVITSDDPDVLVITKITGTFEFGEILSVGGVPMTKIVEVPIAPTKKDYFFDGSAGLFQNVDNSNVWVFPSMRRGGRMIYGFNVTDPTTPRMMWRVGCSNPDLSDTASCTTGFEQMGQTWSLPNVALVKGFSSDVNRPVIIVGGGYDSCDDEDQAPNTLCTSPKGNRVFVLDASTGVLLKALPTTGSVVGDVTLLDRDFDGFVDQAFAADTKGGIYRIDFADPTNPGATRAPGEWTITEIARSSGANRKFLFAPAALGGSGKVFLSLASGDRERPLITNYPFDSVKGGPVVNRAYMFIDKFERTTDPVTGVTTGSVVNLDDASLMQDFTTDTTCTTASPEANNKRGWFFDLNAGTGEQGVTSSTIFGGLVFFSTNRPLPTPPGACANSLGEARGYAVNLLNASGAVGTQALCGAQRSGIFVGGGLPPSPVTGTVPVGGKPVTIMIGGIQRSTGIGSPIEGQQVKPNVTQRRNRMYWYSHGDK